MRKAVSSAKKTCMERLFETTKRENIEKAIIIENNQIYTYGYERTTHKVD